MPESNPVETSSNAPQPEKKALSTQDAAKILRNSMIGDIGEETDKSAKQEKEATKTTRPSKKPKKGQSEKTSENNEVEEAEETELDEDADIEDADIDEDSQSEDDEDDVEEDGAEDDDDPETDSDEDEANGDDESEVEDEDFHTVIVDGEELEITYDELISGYQRQADYTKKSMELAQQRKALDAEKEKVADLPKVKEKYQKEADKFSQNAVLVMTAFQHGFMPPKPDETLRQENPAEYIAQKEKHQEALQFVHGLKHEMKKYQHLVEQEQQKKVKEGRVKLLEVQPELQTPEHRGKLQKYIIEAGFTEDQMKNEADHRLFEFAYKAMKWDEMIERSKKKPEPKKKHPKVMKQRKSRDDKSSVVKKRNSEAVSRHKREHSIKSASAVISQKLQSGNRKRR